ncbi:malto-oligosyltrehalose synthase [Spirillospora sp. CA-294931]|uniref:malto-oligosyltrehalose synthase n=1 Tax=Spirillospora sp. CA-294931 TaxID=3240042 RepID=UPI003D8B2F69
MFAVVEAVPTGTYRLQLRGDGLGFAEAAELAPYLASLGVSHVYLSPVLQAVPGSTHGYDVIDHGRISGELGGREGLRALASRYRECGLGVVIDIVPNHMAIPDPVTLNRPLAAVLEEGPGSPYARWFDVDWEAGGGGIVLPGDGEPNYRRFFDISGLIALRQEDEEVFEATHAVLLDLVAEGLVDGLRVDHPDGLADPRGYLGRLAGRAPGRWILVEKITAGDEELPPDWACAGTTGYDSLGIVGGIFVDPEGELPLSAAYTAVSADPRPFPEIERQSRRDAVASGLHPEVARLHRVLQRALPAPVPSERALVELLVAMPVYRAYVIPGEEPTDDAMAVVDAALRGARLQAPELHKELDVLARMVLGIEPDAEEDAQREFVVRFQQTSAPVVAKGVEDTAFYRWSRMAALNEVGGDPERFSVGLNDFHAHCERLARDWPRTMTTLSTHDTKRQEDVRARLAVLSEIPDRWAAAVERWRNADGSPLEPDLEYLLWQTLVGAWPLTQDRLDGYLLKAMREAKGRTSWAAPDTGYEEAVLAYAGGALADADLISDLTGFVAALEPYARANILGQKLVQLTMPGVPDVYQGCELQALSLVDPDNRRPVDYKRRGARLARLDAGLPPEDLDDEKLLVTSRALRERRAHPEWFGGPYERVPATGPAGAHVIAFRRGGALTVATRLRARLEHAGGWDGTRLDTGGGSWRDVFTGEVHEEPRLADALRTLPVALLIAEEGGG